MFVETGNGARCENHIMIRANEVLPSVSDFLVFRLRCGGPASTIVVRQTSRVRIRCPALSKAKMKALTYVECIGCLGNELRPKPAKKR